MDAYKLRITLAFVYSGDVRIGQVSSRKTTIKVELLVLVIRCRPLQALRLIRSRLIRVIIAAVDLPVHLGQNTDVLRSLINFHLLSFKLVLLELKFTHFWIVVIIHKEPGVIKHLLSGGTL